MTEEIKAPSPVNMPRLKNELDYLRQIEDHLRVIRQIIVFVVIISAVAALMQLCVIFAGLMGIQLY